MDFDRFLGAVQHESRLESTDSALRVTRITLTTLSERIQPEEAADLAAQLPGEIGRFLTAVDTVESFSFDEFVDRLVERGHYHEDDRADAVHDAQVVVEVLSQAVSPGEMQQVRGQLPATGWETLFELADQQTNSSPGE